ncbi:DUF4097 family beta strand repeat protein [Anaerocolumna sedimenticola]|uniref:DUF4097 family beta strand repeat protein n=1 Tax=Anaerocolumna sedimenticola TaxID=2696063 RepID=A0A6P1TQX5_9FIRM|nr:DUF4097 family beta strand repeat-containing protein [Anaerocolumna sedimenticola]QHQ62883.1 DUF4097 family beta strand repeat protein [Anaerocolumna sedimenticola]
MRRFIIIMVTAFTVITAGLICLMIVAINAGGLRRSGTYFGSSNLKLVNTQNVSLDGIQTLTIDYYADDVTFYEGDTSELILNEYMSYTPNDDDLTRIIKNGSKARLDGRRDNYRGWFFNFNRSSRVEIYLPSDYKGELSVSTSSGNISSDMVFAVRKFKASCSSGDIKLTEVYAENIDAATSSGNISIDKAEGTRNIRATSGDIKILGGEGDTGVSSASGNITIEASKGSLEAEASSGDITIRNSSGQKDIETTSGQIVITDSDGYTEASASSGDIRINDFGGAGNFETTSGVIKLAYAEDAAAIEEDIIIKASSGDVNLTLPAKAEFNFKAQTSSGDIRTSFDDSLAFDKNDDHASGIIGSNPSFDLKVTTNSGSIHVD